MGFCSVPNLLLLAYQRNPIRDFLQQLCMPPKRTYKTLQTPCNPRNAYTLEMVCQCSVNALVLCLPVGFANERSSPRRIATGLCHDSKDYTKDFSGARRAGWHAILLNRYNEKDRADEWKRRGAIVLDDLMDVVFWLGQSGCKLG